MKPTDDEIVSVLEDILHEKNALWAITLLKNREFLYLNLRSNGCRYSSCPAPPAEWDDDYPNWGNKSHHAPGCQHGEVLLALGGTVELERQVNSAHEDAISMEEARRTKETQVRYAAIPYGARLAPEPTSPADAILRADPDCPVCQGDGYSNGYDNSPCLCCFVQMTEATLRQRLARET